jgi:protein TonB
VRLFTHRKREGTWLYALGLALALGLHAAGIVGAQKLKTTRRGPTRVEMAMVKKEPPPPPPPPVETKKEPPKPKEPPKKVAKAFVKPDTPPPPPNQAPPKDAPKKPVPILAGVTLESTVEGPSGFQVAVGNTLYEDPNLNKSKPQDVKPYAAPVYREAPPVKPVVKKEVRVFKPVPKFSVSTEPEVQQEVKAVYPSDARQAGIQGVVELRVELWEDGTVRMAKVVRGLGYGLDEAAVEAIMRFRFKPATVDGVPVQYTIPRYAFRFVLEG